MDGFAVGEVLGSFSQGKKVLRHILGDHHYAWTMYLNTSRGEVGKGGACCVGRRRLQKKCPLGPLLRNASKSHRCVPIKSKFGLDQIQL